MPPLPKDPVAVILLDEQITTVRDSGEIDSLYSPRLQNPSPRRPRYATATSFVEFDKDTKISSLKAWTLPVNGKDYEVREKDAMETSLFSDSLYSDMRAKLSGNSRTPLPATWSPTNMSRSATLYFRRSLGFPGNRSRPPHPLHSSAPARLGNENPVGQSSGGPGKRTGENSYTWEIENVPGDRSRA